MNEPSVPRAPDACPACRSRRRWAILLIVTVAAALAAVLGGYAAGNRHCEERCHQQGRRQFIEFLRIGTQLGIVTIDRQRLDEAICISGESTGEDADAAERGEGGGR